MRYYFKIIDSLESNPTFKTTYYYYGWKSIWGLGKVRNLDDFYSPEEIKTYKSKKQCETIARRIICEKFKAYPWMQFTFEIHEYTE